MSDDPHVRQFLRAAYQRLETAAVLIRNQRWLDAVYLQAVGRNVL